MKKSAWEETIQPKKVIVPLDLYQDYLPKVNIFFTPVYDFNIIQKDEEISREINSYLKKISKELGIDIYITDIINQISAILSKRLDKLRIKRGKKIIHFIVDNQIYNYISMIQNLINVRLFLFEDYLNLKLSKNDNELIISNEIKKNYLNSEKNKKIINLIKNNLTKKIVIFCRYILVCENLNELLINNEIKSTTIHSQVSKKNETERLLSFKDKETKNNVLIITRKKFGRGFDLPEADIAIFYSPKDDVRVIWQEVLRIRGTVKKPKNIYFIYYVCTAEYNKTIRLLKKMFIHGAILKERFIEWTFQEEKEVDDLEKIILNKKKEDNYLILIEKVIEYVRNINNIKQEMFIKNISNILEYLGFFDKFLKKNLILLFENLYKFTENINVKEDKLLIKSLIRFFHPDSNVDINDEMKTFINEITIKLNEKL